MFTTYSSIENIETETQVGYLYIFEATYYDSKNCLVLNDSIKIGMTRGSIKKRLSQYTFPPKNISFIQCSIPSKREGIIKYYIKKIMKIQPSHGTEYFNRDNRTEIEKVLSYFALCEDEYIIKYYNLDKSVEYKKWIYYISDILHPHFFNPILEEKFIDVDLSLDLSQKRIDSIIEERFTYDIYKKEEVMDEVIMEFFLNKDRVNVAYLIDKDDMIFKILEKNIGKYIYIDYRDIHTMCNNSIPMMKKLEEYEARIILEYNSMQK